MMVPSVLVVVVNYRTADLTIDCLESLEDQVATRPETRVVVVDNASNDGSAERLDRTMRQRGWGDWVELVPLTINGGFAAGNNAAIIPSLTSHEPPDYVWLLNPDTQARPDALEQLVGFLETHPEVGLAGSRLEDPDGTAQGSAFRFPSLLGEIDGGLRLGIVSRLLRRWVEHPRAPDHVRPVDWVAGASLMVRRAVFNEIGPLDDGYFMYFEEVDFCRRALRAGWPCWYVPGSRVVHLVGQASGVSDPRKVRKRRPAYWFEARRRYFLRHLGRSRTMLADLLWACGFASFRARRLVQRKPDADPEKYLRDFVRYNLLPVRR